MHSHHRSRFSRGARLLRPAGLALLAAAIISSGMGATLDLPTASPTPSVSSAPTGTDFHVACKKGARAGTGTTAHPWNSLRQIEQHGRFAPGDRILLRRGTTCAGTLDLTGSGILGDPITLGAEGRGSAPTIAGGGSKSGTAAVRLTNVSYWTVQDLRLTNTDGRWNTGTYRAGLLIRSTSKTRQYGIIARHLLIEHVDSNPGGRGDKRAYGGIAVQTTAGGSGFDGTLIQGNRVLGVGRSGIAVFNRAYPRSSDRDLRITGNTVRWARGDSIVVSGADGARIDHNVSAYGSNIAHCSVRQCGRMGGPSTANAAIWPTMSSLVRIDHNEVYGEHRSAGDGSGIDVDLGAHQVTVEQNYLHDNENGGVMFCGAQNTTVRFNILQNNGVNSIWFTCGWQKNQRPLNITITNNDIVQKASARWVVRNVHPFAGRNIRFSNNVVFCAGTCAYSWPNKPVAASNTYVGTRSRTEPKGSGTSHTRPGLRNPGSGRTGWSSLSGYRFKHGAHPAHGVGIPGAVSDVFGSAVNAKRPPRGATA
ncbi:right-handed parallel beta-helix repeat-containing protein [Amnibacterium sp.]|uniref:right-handed parallel beta-helix repeat-containing protein n=1 Tax=Amnibacterium sp. TaxID=1872496 RepID=UPI003F7BE92E